MKVDKSKFVNEFKMRGQRREKGVLESLKDLEENYKPQAELQRKRVDLRMSANRSVFTAVVNGLKDSGKELKDSITALHDIDKLDIESALKLMESPQFELPRIVRRPYEIRNEMCESCGKTKPRFFAMPPGSGRPLLDPAGSTGCPPGYHIDETGNCVPDGTGGQCPPGQTLVFDGNFWVCRPISTPPPPASCANLYASGVWTPAGHRSVGPYNFDASYQLVNPTNQFDPTTIVSGNPSLLSFSADSKMGNANIIVGSTDNNWAVVGSTMMIGKHFVPPTSKGLINFSAEVFINAMYKQWFGGFGNPATLGASLGLAVWEMDPSNNYAVNNSIYFPTKTVFMDLGGIFTPSEKRYNFLNQLFTIDPNGSYETEIRVPQSFDYYGNVTSYTYRWAPSDGQYLSGPPWNSQCCPENASFGVDDEHEYILWVYINSNLTAWGADKYGYSHAVSLVNAQIPSINWAYYSY